MAIEIACDTSPIWELQCSACGKWHLRDDTWSLGGQYAGQPADHPTTGFPCITPGNHVGTIAASRRVLAHQVRIVRRDDLMTEQVWAQVWEAQGITFTVAMLDPGFYGPGVIEAISHDRLENYRAETISEAIDGLLAARDLTVYG